MSVLEEFRKQSETLCHLQNVKRLLNWDQQIVMTKSPQAVSVRGRQQAALSLLLHQTLTGKPFAELLLRAEEAASAQPESIEAQSVGRWKRERRRASAVSAQLVEDLSITGAQSFEAWRQAKEKSDFSIFEPWLTKMFDLKREEAKQIGYQDHPYDPMLDEFEPGMTYRKVKELFAELRPHLEVGVQKIAASPLAKELESTVFDLDFPVEGQKILSRRLAEALGYPQQSRLDEGTHPFCSAASSHDVRLVTRYHQNEVATAIFATLHETGHGLYEMYSPPELEYTPLRGGASLGVHESQSRLWENLVGRSSAFWQWAFPVVKDLFPEQCLGRTSLDFYQASNRVRPSLIRVEADEVTYSLHVIMRFELESALLAKEIEARDLPHLWNEKIRTSLDLDVPDDAHGCLQDIHWSDGLIGYFPTYALGNLIASDLWLKIEKALPDLQEQMGRGQFSDLLSWLRTNLYDHASRWEPIPLLQKVLGHEIRTAPFVSYLQNKYSSLYGIDWK